jgi:hypothetical protein
MNNFEPLPHLIASRGLTARQLIFCDGRTSLRLQHEPEGFSLLVHYSPDSWKGLNHVLRMPGVISNSQAGLGQPVEPRPATLEVDGSPHRIDWVEVWPFSYTNREERPTGTINSRFGIVQGGLQWVIQGSNQSVSLTIPRAMFVEHDNYKDGKLLDHTTWEFPETSTTPTESGESQVWNAVRRETWTFRDNSTFAGIAGKEVAPEPPRRSELHFCVGANTPFTVTDDGVAFRFTAAAASEVALAIGLGSSEADARRMVADLTTDPQALARTQQARFATAAAETPQMDFGRHTALKKFFRVQPLMLEAMRIADNPGAFRGNNEYHWVWEWDMARPAFAILASGRHDFVKELLDFYARTGYCDEYDNSLTRDCRSHNQLPAGTPTRLEYMLAHDYLAWTGNIDATRAWRSIFVKGILAILERVDSTGMLQVAAASTDYPEEFGRTWKGWLAYPSAWDYSAYCSAEKLLLAWGDIELAGRVRDLTQILRRNFRQIFWNDQTGFWNEGVHPMDPDLVCDIPLSTAMAGMDSPYGEDLYGDKLAASAEFCEREFLREDGIHIITRNEKRGWKEWTRQPHNWFSANDTQLARLFRATGNVSALEKLFYLYEMNYGYQPAAFEGKPFHKPLNTSGSWHVFGAGAWYRNLVECAAGLWADLGGLGLIPGGLGEPITLKGLRFRDATIHFSAVGQGSWPRRLLVDGQPLIGTTKFPVFTPGAHRIEVEYGPGVPAHPVLILAVDATVHAAVVERQSLHVSLKGQGYTPLSFFAPEMPVVTLDGQLLPVEWNATTGRGRTRCELNGDAQLIIRSGQQHAEVVMR